MFDRKGRNHCDEMTRQNFGPSEYQYARWSVRRIKDHIDDPNHEGRRMARMPRVNIPESVNNLYWLPYPTSHFHILQPIQF